MSGITAVSTQAALPCFVVAREKAWYAVDLQLLQFMTGDLQRSGGTFTSAIHAWAKLQGVSSKTSSWATS
eukprot:5510238-Pyramimonas_sp.AAC.1